MLLVLAPCNLVMGTHISEELTSASWWREPSSESGSLQWWRFRSKPVLLPTRQWPYLLRRAKSSHTTTDGRSVSQYVKVSSPLVTRCYFLSEGCFLKVAVLSLIGRPLWWEVGSVICFSQSVVIYKYLHHAFRFHVFYSPAIYMQYIQAHIETAD
jgi:hypothetical protein